MLTHIWSLLVLMLPSPASLMETSSYRGSDVARTTEDRVEAAAGGEKRGRGRPQQIYAWKYFRKGPRDPETSRRRAFCLACDREVVSKEVDMERHLMSCNKCDSVRVDIRNEQRLRVIDDPAGAESDEEHVGRKRIAREVSITPFLARKPTAKEQAAIEDLIVRYVASAGVPFTTVDNPAFRQLMEMRTGFMVPNRCKLGTSILDREAARCREKVLGELQQHANLTVCTNGWTDCSKKSIQGTVVVTPERLVYPLGFVDTSNVRHTAKEMLEQLLALLASIDDPSRVVAICTDNAGSMKLLRSLLMAEDAYKHVISIRCHMHAFGLLLVSLLRHPWANRIVYRAQSIVSFFRESPYLYNRLKTFPNAPTNKSLQSSNTTRMTSVEMMLASVSSYSNALQLFAAAGATDPDLDIPVRNSDSQRTSRASTVKDTIRDPEFHSDLHKLLLLLTPISKIIMAIQSCESTMADVTRYWIYLSRELSRSLQKFPSGFQRHVVHQYNRRYKELDSPVCRLALLLHPCYRKAAAPTHRHIEELFEVAHNLLQKYDRGSPRRLASKIGNYVMERPPYHMPCGGKDFGREAAKAWWRATGDPGSCPLVAVALLLLDVIPTAASTERVFSTMGWTKSKTRNRMNPDTLAKLTTIKMVQDLQQKPPTSNKQADKAASEIANGNTGQGMSLDDMFLPMPDEDLSEVEVEQTINHLATMDDEDNEEDWEAEGEAAQGSSFVQLLMDDWWPVNKQHPTMTLEGARVNETEGGCDETSDSTTPAESDTLDGARADLKAHLGVA